MNIRVHKTPIYEIDTEFIPAHYQPALLTDLALQRGIDDRELFRGVRLNLAEIKSARKKLSPEQYLTLIANCQKLVGVEGISFLYGQTLFPGLYGASSMALQKMGSCRQVIEYLCHYHIILSPLLTPRYYENEKHLFIYWQDSSGADEQFQFLIEANMKGLASMLDWFSAGKLPWQYQFSYDQPSYIEQYWVNFGHDISFNQQLNMMVLPKEYVEKSWSQSKSIGNQATLSAASYQLIDLAVEKSFLDWVYDYLMLNIQQTMNLDKLSGAFKLSPASMKRKLKKHNTSFQKQLDLARKNTAIYLFYVKAYNDQQIAKYLQFSDISNFRRAFKRWTGFSPNTIFQIYKTVEHGG